MSWAQVDKQSATGVNPTVTMAAAPSSGELMVAVVGSGGSVTPAMTASGVAWTTGPTTVFGINTVKLFYKVAGGSEVAAQGATAGSIGSLVVFRYTGGPSSGPLDVSASGADSVSAVTTQTAGTTAAVAATGELVIAAVRVAGNISGQTWSNSYVAEYADTRLFASSLIAGTGTQTTALSWTTAARAAGVIAAFKTAAAAASILPYASPYRQVPFRG